MRTQPDVRAEAIYKVQVPGCMIVVSYSWLPWCGEWAADGELLKKNGIPHSVKLDSLA
jgi:hypothetical protein